MTHVLRAYPLFLVGVTTNELKVYHLGLEQPRLTAHDKDLIAANGILRCIGSASILGALAEHLLVPLTPSGLEFWVLGFQF